MNDPITRRQLVQRGAAGISLLSLPGLLAACGGGGDGGGGSSDDLKDVLNFSNWPFYIDVDEKTKKHPSIDEFTKKTGIKVNYFEDINDNAEYFAKVQARSRRGRASTATSSSSPTTPGSRASSSTRGGCRSSTRSGSRTSST